MAKAKPKKAAPKAKPAPKKAAPSKKAAAPAKKAAPVAKKPAAPVKKAAPAKKPAPVTKSAPAKKPVAVAPVTKKIVEEAKPKKPLTPAPAKTGVAETSVSKTKLMSAVESASVKPGTPAPKLTPVVKPVKPIPIPKEVLTLKDKPTADGNSTQEKREIHQSDIFSEEELRMFLDALKKERASLLEKARAAVDAGNIALDKDEMYDEVDLASATVDQNLMFRLLDRDRKLLSEIDHAIQKIQTGEFGYCEGTGEPIPKRRLELRPWCRHSVKYKEQLEKLEKSGRGVVDEDAELLD